MTALGAFAVAFRDFSSPIAARRPQSHLHALTPLPDASSIVASLFLIPALSPSHFASPSELLVSTINTKAVLSPAQCTTVVPRLTRERRPLIAYANFKRFLSLTSPSEDNLSSRNAPASDSTLPVHSCSSWRSTICVMKVPQNPHRFAPALIFGHPDVYLQMPCSGQCHECTVSCLIFTFGVFYPLEIC